jgi:hypothetical protein
MMNVLLINDFITTNDQDFVNRIFTFLYKIFRRINPNINIDTDKEFNFDKRKFFKFNDIKHNHTSKYFITKCTPNKESIDYIKNKLCKYDLLICYELSHMTKGILNEIEIEYIDIWLSPLRFLNDLKFCMWSSNKRIHRIIKNSIIDENWIYDRANDIKNYLKESEINSDNKNNILLIICQLAQDKSVFNGKRFLRLKDYEEKLIDLSECYGNAFILKHPLQSDEEFVFTKKSLSGINNLKTISDNIYKLLCRNDISHIVALSSSVLEEAKYFEKQSTYLFKPVVNGEYVLINDSIFDASFWSNVLSVKSNSSYSFLKHDNYIRNMLGESWSYKIMLNTNETKNTYNNIVSFLNILSRIDRDKSYSLYGFGTITKFIVNHTSIDIDFIIDDSSKFEEYNKVKITRIEKIPENSNIIITPFYDNNLIIRELSERDFNIIRLNEF